MKLWITGGIAVAWVIVFSAWVVSQDGTPTDGTQSTEATRSAAANNQPGKPPTPQSRADWKPQRRGPSRHWERGGSGGDDRMQRNTFILGVVLLHTLDQNKDAILSETEIAGAQQALLSLDENKDGEVSGEEFAKAMPKTMEGMRGWRSDRGGAPHPFHDRGRRQDHRGRKERPEQDEASVE